MTTRQKDEDRVYRALIDRLVESCQKGQGKLGARRALTGVWNVNASPTRVPDQHEINLLLKRMPKSDRKIVARMLEDAFVSGVHQALVALHEAELAPFDKAYEGTPFHDFVGRLDGWRWPRSMTRE